MQEQPGQGAGAPAQAGCGCPAEDPVSSCRGGQTENRPAAAGECAAGVTLPVPCWAPSQQLHLQHPVPTAAGLLIK